MSFSSAPMIVLARKRKRVASLPRGGGARTGSTAPHTPLSSSSSTAAPTNNSRATRRSTRQSSQASSSSFRGRGRGVRGQPRGRGRSAITRSEPGADPLHEARQEAASRAHTRVRGRALLLQTLLAALEAPMSSTLSPAISSSSAVSPRTPTASPSVTDTLPPTPTRRTHLDAQFHSSAPTHSKDSLEGLVQRIERSLWEKHDREDGAAYRSHLRSLLFNLGASENAKLVLDLVTGRLTAEQLCELDVQQLATRSRQRLRTEHTSRSAQACIARDSRTRSEDHACPACSSAAITYAILSVPRDSSKADTWGSSTSEPVIDFFCEGCGLSWKANSLATSLRPEDQKKKKMDR